VGLDEVRLLVGLRLLLRLAQLLDQTHGLTLQASVDSASGAGVDDITELVRGQVEEPVRSGEEKSRVSAPPLAERLVCPTQLK
jgi:hypothetical protein